MVRVDTDDVATVLFRFAGGVTGHMEMSRVALGRRMEVGYDVTGTEGALRYHYDRLNELQLFREAGPQETRGFQRIEMGPTDPRYAAFYPVPGIGAGYNDFKVMEAQAFLEAIVAGEPGYPDFRFGAEVQRLVDGPSGCSRDAEERWTCCSPRSAPDRPPRHRRLRVMSLVQCRVGATGRSPPRRPGCTRRPACLVTPLTNPTYGYRNG